MLSLPALKKSFAPKPKPLAVSYLKVTPLFKQYTQKSSILEKQGFDAAKQKYLYIDFEMDNSVIELEKQQYNDYESEDEIEAIGEKKIGGLKNLKKMSPSSYKMHAFLTEERAYLEKRKKWDNILGKQMFRDSLIQFSKMKEKVDPEKLEQFLERKEIQRKWRKIEQREQKMYENEEQSLRECTSQVRTINKSSLDRYSKYQTRNVSDLKTARNVNEAAVRNSMVKPRHKFNNRLKLKALQNLNNLLEG